MDSVEDPVPDGQMDDGRMMDGWTDGWMEWVMLKLTRTLIKILLAG